ncbi:hypothetical protein AB0I06_28195 [Streptomyces sp. NPDC050674]|uniref:SCO4402 family protein n=1 Tax=Streptomyces sp. NPDC050674 TaxID=3157216 RepID=UPI00341D5453
MSEDARLIANHRVHVVPVVLALANPPWQRDVWLDPSVFENLDHVFHTLFDDFCDADEPERPTHEGGGFVLSKEDDGRRACRSL